jgi:hypothetical protein
LLSKWRVFALRPRFWWVNIKANLVDFSVGISIVGLLYLSMASLPLQIIISIGFGVWLLYLKPRSDSKSIKWQAGIAQFLAFTTLYSFSTFLNEFLVIAGAWVIGYMAARHIISNYDEEYSEFLSMAWALLTAQLGWLAYRWTLVYDIQLPIAIPQIALVTLVGGYVAAQLYTAYKTNKLSDVVIRSTVILGVILLTFILVFSRWNIAI